MSTTRDTGFLRNAVQVTNQGIVFVSGSTLLMSISSSGAVTTTGVISGSNALSASFSLNSALLNGTGSVGFTTTASFLAVSSSQQQISSSLLQVSASYISLSGSYTTFSGSASTRITANSSSIQQVSSSQQQISASLLNVVANYATTGSNSFRANQSITGSLVVSSTITAQTLVVQTVTSSIVYSSGSNLFGSALGDRQTFTGSVNITGSQNIFGNVGTNYAAQSNIRSYIYDNSANYGLVVQQDGSGAIAQFSGNSGAVRMYISASGNVGIGTSSPLYKLSVANELQVGAQGGSDMTYISGGSGFGSTITQYYATGPINNKLRGNGDNYFNIIAGNFGIGNSSPSYSLDVTGTGRFTSTLTVGSTISAGVITGDSNSTGVPSIVAKVGGGGNNGTFGFGNTSSYRIRGGSDYGKMIFDAGTSDQMTLTSAGNVGIGTSSPNFIGTVGTVVTILGASATNGGTLELASNNLTDITGELGKIEFLGLNGSSSVQSRAIIVSNQDGSTTSSLLRFFTMSAGTVGERMRITSGGNVGIGITNPTSLLHLEKSQNSTTTLLIQNIADGSGAAAELRFYGNTGAGSLKNNQQISFVRGSGGVDWALGQVTDSDDFAIAGGTNQGDGKPSLTTAERMRITSGGNVGIGVTNPEVSFVVKGTSIGSGGKASFYGGGDENNWSAANNEAIRIGRADILNAYYSSIWSASGSSGNETLHWLRFYISNGSNAQALACTMFGNGNVTVAGALSKGSGSFRIKHPLLPKKSTHELVHSFIEGPQADLIYRGKIRLAAGRAVINIDEAATMTEGTFEALCREVQCFTSNETGWDTVRGKVEGNILTIECQNTESTDEISWLVIGERQDEHMMDTDWTDSNGKVIVEPLIPEENNNN